MQCLSLYHPPYQNGRGVGVAFFILHSCVSEISLAEEVRAISMKQFTFLCSNIPLSYGAVLCVKIGIHSVELLLVVCVFFSVCLQHDTLE